MSSATAKITRIFKDDLVPILAERGFVASGTTFRKRSSTATQVVNLQRGSRNSAVSARFHVNGGVYLPALDEVIGAHIVDDPDEPSCHVRLRPNDVVATGHDEYTVTETTDEASFGKATASDLTALIDALEGFEAPEKAVAHLSTKLLTQYERVFGWYLRQNQLDAARLFVSGLRTEFGEERRWDIFANHLDAVSHHVRGDVLWRDWM